MEAEKNSKKDEEKKGKVEVLNKVDSMIFQTERQLKEFDDKLDDKDKNLLIEKLDKLKSSHKNENMKEMATDLKELESIWQQISTKLYEQTNETSENNEESPQTADVEYEEVN